MKRKVILLMILMITIFGNLTRTIPEIKAEELPYTAIAYEGVVKHFFTHELIYSPQKAFSKKNFLRYCFDKDHLLTSEFFNFLEEMRINNYVLVDYDMLYDISDGKINKKTLYLPLNKKPFTLSLDDMSYDTNNRGIINKIIVDENGEIKDYTSDEKEQITNHRESITILEEYLKKYPEFSVNNSKMCICVNGYNGILGYRIQPDSKDKDNEKEELIKVVQALKNKGYTFACHSYSHSFMNSISPEFVAKDLYKWHEYVGSIVGETPIYCFPGGIHDADSYKDRLIRDKYKILLCVGMNMHRKYEETENYIYLYRTPLDGNSLRTYPNMYRDIFEPNTIYDNKSRFIKYYDI